MRYKDHTNKRFGNLVAIEIAERRNKNLYWRCKCDCGKEVIVLAHRLSSGRKTSCGCKNKILPNLDNLCTEDINETLENVLEHYHDFLQNLVDKFYDTHEMGILDKDDLWQFCRIGCYRFIKNRINNSNNDESYKSSTIKAFSIYVYNSMVRGWISNSAITYGVAQKYKYNTDILNNIINESEVYLDDIDPIIDDTIEENLDLRIILNDLITIAKRILPTRNFDIVYKYYIEEKTFIDIAKEYNLSLNRVRQIASSSVYRLRINTDIRELYKCYQKLV